MYTFLVRMRDVQKSILLRTFVLERKSIIIIVRLSLKINYERVLKYIHVYEHFFRGRETKKENKNGK